METTNATKIRKVQGHSLRINLRIEAIYNSVVWRAGRAVIRLANENLVVLNLTASFIMHI